MISCQITAIMLPPVGRYKYYQICWSKGKGENHSQSVSKVHNVGGETNKEMGS